MFAKEASRNLSNLDTTWHHYALTWNDSTMNLYVDGVLCATKTGTANPTGNYFIGQLNRPKIPGDFSVHGLIDDVRFYNRILSENEISTLVQMGNADKR